MRSSVSVILSNPPPDYTMSYPDYSAHPHHHQTLLLLVKQVGTQLKSRSFHKLYERINRVTQVKVQDSAGNPRPVWVTYRKDYPVENNDWGDFQAHRRVLGIITIGQVSNQSDLDSVCKEHETLKVKYSSTLYHSRCIILGLNPDFSVYHPPDEQHSPSVGSSPDPPSYDLIINSLTPGSSPSQKDKVPSNTGDRDSGVYETALPVDSRHTNGDINPHFGAKLHNGLASICRSQVNSAGSDSGSESTSELGVEEGEKSDSPHSTVLNSIHETNHSPIPSSNSSDTSSSSSHTHKLSLQPQFLQHSFIPYLCYPTGDHASNIETQIQEFVSSLFWILEYKRMEKAQEKIDRPTLLCAPFERKDFVGLDLDSRTNKKRCSGRLKKHLADLSLQAGLLGESLAQYSQAIDILRSCNDWLWLAACYEGLCSASVMTLYPHLSKENTLQRYASIGASSSSSFTPGMVKGRNGSITTNSLPTGLEPSTVKQTSKYCLSPDDIVEKYKEAIVHYSKYRNAGVIETEASIKAVYVLIEQKRYLHAAEFLNNVVFINLQLSDEEKIRRFTALADLYHQIGFHRKASFFLRVAAMRCVAPQIPIHNWQQCYKLLLLTLDGYRICLDPIQFTEDGRPGWPALQIQILHELKGTSQRMGEQGLCTRHQAFILTAMLPYLTDSDKQDCYNMLEAVSSKAPSGTGPMVVSDTAIIVPPVNMINIPSCRNVRIMPPPKERQVERKFQPSVEDHGPFIFSPFQSIHAGVKPPGKIDCDWVEGDVCEVVLTLENPMPFQLKLTSMMLLTEGVEFESWTSTVALEAHQDVQAVSLRGRPQETGELRIIGFSLCLAGVTSICKFKSLTHLKVPFYSLNIVPALPCVQIFCDSMPPSEEGLEDKAKINLCLDAGESKECNIIIHNVSSQPVEDIEISLESTLDNEAVDQVFQYSINNLKDQLPVGPGGRACLTLCIYGAFDFLLPGYSLEEDDGTSITAGLSEPPSLTSTGPPSLHSRHSTIMSSLRGHRAKRVMSSPSIVSSRSGGSSIRSNSSNSLMGGASVQGQTSISNPALSSRHFEGTLKISYSGALGLENNYWRVSHLNVQVEVIPTLLVTQWDAIPSEMPMQCYISLDFLNSSPYEVDLYYTPTRNIIIQAKESCRVPVPVDRCPISRLNQSSTEPLDNGHHIQPRPQQTPGEILGDHVASLVELRWQLLSKGTSGRASLKSITFPPKTHHLITMAPIHWNVELNGEPIEGGVENPGILGYPQSFIVKVTNTSGASLPPLLLSLTAFQDHQNGFQNFELYAKMSVSGSTKLVIPELPPNESFTHNCSLVFFSSGIFKIEFSCSPLHERTSLSDRMVDFEGLQRGVGGPSYQTWKLAPPIEMAISDS